MQTDGLEAERLETEGLDGPVRFSIERLAVELRGAWSADTAWIDDWDAANPSRGQCGTTALVVQDFRGGALMRGLVEGVLGDRTVHYWNALRVGQLDLTWDQFPTDSRIVLGERVQRGDMLTTTWLAHRYVRLRGRVALG